MITRKIFLDLEETIIDSWHNPVLVNVGKIKKFLKKQDEPFIGIFSFAIWNDKDKEDFTKLGIKSMIETALEVRIGKILTIPEIAKDIFWKNGVVLTVNEFITIWGKQRAFIDWAMMQPRMDEGEQEFILVDDVVRNLTVIDNDHGGDFRIKTINVGNL